MANHEVIDDDRFRDWAEFLEEWVFLSRRYERHSVDLSFWHSEMTGVSLLSSAINRSAYSSIVEFKQYKSSGGNKVVGRGDLYIANDTLSEYAECKTIWPNVLSPSFKITCENGLEGACKDTKRLKIRRGEQAGKVGILFVCPWVNPSKIDKVNDAPHNWPSLAKSLGAGAVAWHFPDQAKEFKGYMDRTYLGAAIMIKNVQPPTKF